MEKPVFTNFDLKMLQNFNNSNMQSSIFLPKTHFVAPGIHWVCRKFSSIPVYTTNYFLLKALYRKPTTIITYILKV